MSFWDFTRSAASAQLMVDFGREEGITASKLLKGTKLSSEQICDPNLQLMAGQELRIARNLLDALKHRAGLGIQVGMRYHFSTYGIWGYGLISSAMARDAMDLSLRFLPLTYAFTVVRYREEGRLGELSYGAPDLPDDMKAFLIERDMAASVALMREVVGKDFCLTGFTFNTDNLPQHAQLASVIRKTFGVEPEFGASANSLLFEKAILDRPLPQANPLTVAMCEQICKRLMDERRTRLGTAAMVRHYLSAAPGTIPFDLNAVSRMMNMSERTLKRKLHDEGTKFSALLNETRAAMAEEMLTEGGLTLTQIADRMGFSDLSTFSQAFKRWFGASPRNFIRESNRQQT